MRHIFLTLLFASIFLAQAANATTDIVVLTGSIGVKPAGADTKARDIGYGRELIGEVMKDAILTFKVEPQPFARALQTIEAQPNTVLFPLLRNAEREAKFQWVGLMAKRSYSFYRLASRRDLVIASLDDARRYRIGVVRGDVRADYLRDQGFSEGADKGLHVVNAAFNLLKMQELGRIDLVVFSDVGLKLACEEAEIACDLWEPAFKLDIAGDLWLAASPKMPPQLFNALRKAYKKQEDSGYLGKLMKSGRAVGG